MKFKCQKCGEEHDGWPALAFAEPHPYHTLTAEEKQSIATISDDFCKIVYEDQTDYFIRVVLFQKVIDHCQNLDYGVWVSVSEKTYNTYSDRFDAGDLEGKFFGFLCSKIPGYENTLSVKTDVIILPGSNRPEIVPHGDQMTHPFVADYYNGITKEEAEARIERMIKSLGQK